MRHAEEHRSSARISIGNLVRLSSNGRVIATVVAMNLSLGGILLKAQSPLPVGSPIEVSVLSSEGGAESLHAMGKVIRSGTAGTAVQFSTALAPASLEAVVAPATSTLVGAYRAYFEASQSLDKCEALLGVTEAQFRKVFYATFSGSLVTSVLSVWLLRASIPPYPNAVKIILAFIYGAAWLLLLQPALDIAIFRRMRKKAAAKAAAS